MNNEELSQRTAKLSDTQRRLVGVILTTNLELSERVDKLLVAALDANDIGADAESLFEEALRVIRREGRPDDYMFLPVLLHYCAFLSKCGRDADYAENMMEFERIGAKYAW